MTKIRVAPGRPVQLDSRRSTSVRGGTYDISTLSDEDRKRVLATKGVTEVKPTTAKKET